MKSRIILSMPPEAAAKLLEGRKNRDPKLLALLEEFKIEDIVPRETEDKHS